MAAETAQNLRNIGIIAHIDAGKTTLSERILYYCQKIHKLGEVHDGAATMDYLPEEQERGITITSACTSCNWRNTRINLVDTPGHVDFTIEVERCLRILDGAIGVFCAVAGVEPQSETVWSQSEYFKIPKIAFINKMDRQGANFENALESMRKRLGANPVALTIPVGTGETFSAVIDLVNWEKLVFDQVDQGQTIHKLKLEGEDEKLAKDWQDTLLEKLAEADDQFLELWLEGQWQKSDVMTALSRAVKTRKLVPVFAGSALRNIGVQPLLDAACAYLPSPEDARPVQALAKDDKPVAIKSTSHEPTAALVFKVLMENGRKNCFLRLYSGAIREGDALVNARTGKTERIGRLYRMHADRKESLKELEAGDIAVAVGLRDARTGDSWCAKNRIVKLDSIPVPEPVITIALEPLNSDEGKVLDEALSRYAEEDPTLKFSLDEESSLRMLSGMGELHLDVVLEKLEREYKIKPRRGLPQVVLRETISQPASASFTFDRELGKEKHHGHVEIAVKPLERGAGARVLLGEFLPENPNEAKKIMPKVYTDAVLDGINDGLQSGPLGGWPVMDLEVTITGIERIEGLTTVPGLAMAAGQALKLGLEKAGPRWLEPVMLLEISTQEEYLGAVIGLFTQLGGNVEDVGDKGTQKYIKGTAPLKKLFGFSTELRSATQGRAGFMMSFKAFDSL